MIIMTALTILKNELKDYLEGRSAWTSTNNVHLSNIGQLDISNNVDYKESVLIGLVNTERENTLRNTGTYRKTSVNGTFEYTNPYEYLNLYILFCSNFDSHDKALTWLSYIFEFFQSKNCFNYMLSPSVQNSGMSGTQKAEFELVLDHHSLTFEQVNHLWGSLGGKQLPFALYKARLVEIKSEQVTGSGTPIEQIQSVENIY